MRFSLWGTSPRTLLCLNYSLRLMGQTVKQIREDRERSFDSVVPIATYTMCVSEHRQAFSERQVWGRKSGKEPPKHSEHTASEKDPSDPIMDFWNQNIRSEERDVRNHLSRSVKAKGLLLRHIRKDYAFFIQVIHQIKKLISKRQKESVRGSRVGGWKKV